MLNEVEFKGITMRINQAKDDRQEIHIKMSNQYANELAIKEKNIICQLEKWSMIEESVMQQKARAMWIKLGHSNTSYFSIVTRDMKQKKRIIEIDSQKGRRLVEVADIKNKIIQFHQSLMVTALPYVTTTNRTTMRRGKLLNHAQQITYAK